MSKQPLNYGLEGLLLFLSNYMESQSPQQSCGQPTPSVIDRKDSAFILRNLLKREQASVVHTNSHLHCVVLEQKSSFKYIKKSQNIG